jgi:MFS family permease
MSIATRPTAASQAAVTPRASYKWWIVFMLWWVCFFNYADRQSIFSVFPKLKEEFGFDKVALGLIGSAFMWVYAFGAPIAGFIGDRFPRKQLILGGCLFWSLVTVATSWCSRFWHFVTVRALEGFGETFYFPASMSFISDYHSYKTRSRAMSFHQSSVYIGTILGSWWGAWFAEHHGWRMGFYFFGLSGIVLVFLLGRFLIEPVRGQSETEQPPAVHAPSPSVREVLEAIFRTPTAVVLLIVFMGANFVATIFLTWTPTFLVEKFHFKLTAAGLSGSVFIHLASAMSVPISGMLADWISRRLKGGRMLVQSLGLLTGSSFIFLVGTTQQHTTLILAMTLFGLCKGIYDANIFASMYDVVHPRARATAAGLMNTIGWGGGALGPVAVGWFAKHGHYATEIENMSHAIAFGGIIYFAGAALLLFALLRLARHDVVYEWESSPSLSSASGSDATR